MSGAVPPLPAGPPAAGSPDAGGRALAALRLFVTHALGERCLACGEPPASAADCRGPVCAACRDQLALRGEPRCAVCSRPLVSEIGRCTRCRSRTYAFSGNVSLAAYAGVAKRLLYHYKFKERTRLAGVFADALADAGLVDGGCCVIPAPARPRGVLTRTPARFDQVGLLARRLRARTGCAVLPVLRRLPGPAQKRLDYEARASNVAGRIRLAARSPLPARAVLLDDVFTTGATAHECARVLARNGVGEIRVVTVALG